MEGNLRFKIDWASHMVGRKFTVFAVFYFVFEGNFQVQAPGGLIFGGVIERRVFCVTSLGGLYLEGLMHGGPYFRNFTVTFLKKINCQPENIIIYDIISFFKTMKVGKKPVAVLIMMFKTRGAQGRIYLS